MNAKRAELIERMRAVAHDESSGWAVVDGCALRWSDTQATPEGLPPNWWPEPTYRRHVFVTLVSVTSAPILGVFRSPWVRRQDSSVSLARALQVLADPKSALDIPPIAG